MDIKNINPADVLNIFWSWSDDEGFRASVGFTEKSLDRVWDSSDNTLPVGEFNDLRQDFFDLLTKVEALRILGTANENREK